MTFYGIFYLIDYNRVVIYMADKSGGWAGLVMATLPPGSAQIGHQGELQECKRWFFSTLCEPIWLIHRWMVGVGDMS